MLKKAFLFIKWMIVDLNLDSTGYIWKTDGTHFKCHNWWYTGNHILYNCLDLWCKIFTCQPKKMCKEVHNFS